MQACMFQIGLQGLHQLGQHGGYIDPLSVTSYKSFNYDEQNILDSDGLALSQTPEQSFVPYWFHSKARVETDNLQPVLPIPTLDEIRSQHEKFIDENLRKCLNNFSDLEFIGADITILNDSQTEVLYLPEEVLVKTRLPLSVNMDGASTEEIESYLVSIPVPFQEMYVLASQIAQAEAENQYLENLALTLISYYGRPDFTAIPPIIWRESSFVKVSWEQSMVANSLKNLFAIYIPALRIRGTKNDENMDLGALDEQEKAFYESFRLPIFVDENNVTINYSTTEITHIFMDESVYSKVSPSQGNLIVPTTRDLSDGFQPKMLAPEPETRYQFFYDVSYPVLVELRRENLSPEVKDFTFLFALESNIKKNLRWKDYAQGKGPLSWDPSQVTANLVGEHYPNWEASQTVMDIQGNIQEQFPDISLFTNYNQRVSGNITVETYDAKTNEPLEDVQVRLGVGSYAIAYLGLTKLTEPEVSSFTTYTPLVQNGYLSLRKKGYYEYVEPLTIHQNETKHLGQKKLYPLESKNVSIKILEMVAEETTDPWMALGEAGDALTGHQFNFNDDGITVTSYHLEEREMNETEKVFFTLQRILTPGKPAPYTQVTLFNGSQTWNMVDLVPGRYEMRGILLDMNGVVIPANSKRICSGIDCLFLSEEDRYIPDEPINITPAMWGGIEFNETYPWLLSVETTYTNNSITFYAIKFPPPKDIDSLSMIGDVGKYSIQFRSQLVPLITTMSS